MEIRTVLKTDLTKPVRVQNLNGNFFSQDNMANAIYVEVTDNGEPVTLSGGITGYVVRGDGYTVVINGTVEDGKAKVVLNEGCYRVTGAISVVVKAGTTTIGACHGYVYRSSTDSIVDPEHLIPSLNDLLAQIDNCRQATTAANTAAQSARQNATAAGKIDNLTVVAQNAQTASATVSEVDGHKHIAFGLPTVIPDIEVGVTTLNPGENATVDINKQSPYSQEHPKIIFGIPRGETGTITNASGMSIPISDSDSTKIKNYIDNGLAKTLIAFSFAFEFIETGVISTQGVVNDDITANHVVLGYQFYDANGDPTSDILANITWTTTNLGGLNLTIQAFETGSVTLILGNPNNLTPGGGN